MWSACLLRNAIALNVVVPTYKRWLLMWGSDFCDLTSKFCIIGNKSGSKNGSPVVKLNLPQHPLISSGVKKNYNFCFLFPVLLICNGEAQCGKNGKLHGSGCVCVSCMPRKYIDWFPGMRFHYIYWFKQQVLTYSGSNLIFICILYSGILQTNSDSFWDGISMPKVWNISAALS